MKTPGTTPDSPRRPESPHRNGRADPKRRRDISILYGEQQANLSNSLRAAMMREGFHNIRVFSQADALLEAVHSFGADIILTDIDLPGGDVCQMIKDIRESRLGENPFIPTILTTWDPRETVVARVVDCGSDDLLIKPLSPNQILARINQLVYRRKPFVVTSEYVGPDRRKNRDNDGDLPRVDVPNTLRAKALGGADDTDLKQTVAQAMVEISERRLERHSCEVSYLVQFVVPAYRSSTADNETEVQMQRMLIAAEDASRRLRGTRYEHVSEICDALVVVAESICRSHPTPAGKDLKLLPRLAEAMALGFRSDEGADLISREITGTVNAHFGTGDGREFSR